MEEEKAVSASKPKTSSKEAIDDITATGTGSLKSPASAEIKESEELKMEEEEEEEEPAAAAIKEITDYWCSPETFRRMAEFIGSEKLKREEEEADAAEIEESSTSVAVVSKAYALCNAVAAVRFLEYPMVTVGSEQDFSRFLQHDVFRYFYSYGFQPAVVSYLFEVLEKTVKEEKAAAALASASKLKKEAVDDITATGTGSLKSPASAEIKEAEELKMEEEEEEEPAAAEIEKITDYLYSPRTFLRMAEFIASEKLKREEEEADAAEIEESSTSVAVVSKAYALCNAVAAVRFLEYPMVTVGSEQDFSRFLQHDIFRYFYSYSFEPAVVSYLFEVLEKTVKEEKAAAALASASKLKKEAIHEIHTGSPTSPEIDEESEKLKREEKEKAAAATDSASVPNKKETEGDNNEPPNPPPSPRLRPNPSVLEFKSSSSAPIEELEQLKRMEKGKAVSASNPKTREASVFIRRVHFRFFTRPPDFIRRMPFRFFIDSPYVIKHMLFPLMISLFMCPLLLNPVFMYNKLWHNRGESLLFQEVVWLLSFLICFSIVLWIIFLNVMDLMFVFSLSIWCLLFTILTIPLSTHIAAGYLGYALAQRRRRLQTKATDTHMIPMPDNEEAKPLSVPQMAVLLIHALLNLAVAIRLAWVWSHSADYTPVDLMMHSLLPLLVGLLLWITFIVVALGDAFVGEEGLILVIFYFFFIMLSYISILVTWGHTAAILVIWVTVLGLSGFLGYSIGVYKSILCVSTNQ